MHLQSPACAGGVCDSAITGGSGAFTLWLPAAAAGAVAVREIPPSGYLSSGGRAGTTGGAYDRGTDAVSFTGAAGLTYTGLAFGDVPAGSLAPNGTQTVLAGSVVLYPHVFVAGSQGQASFSLVQTPSPALPGWSVVLIQDLDCDGAVDAGEPAIASPIGCATGQTVCLILRHAAPAGAPGGATEQVAIGAAFDYENAVPPLVSNLAATDLTIITAGGLVLTKSVDRSSASPGELLTYTIAYTNPGPTPIGAIEINDLTPAWTSFETASCGVLGTGLTGCVVSAAPAPGGTGPVRWTLAGSLDPGGSGSVTFQVRIATP
jgi:uncharacterized repeat protein (TIGR01451 family)